MKRSISIIIIACLLRMWASAESSVWKVEKDGAVFYLGATCHLLRSSDFPLPPEFDQAYKESDVLIFETDMSQMEDPARQDQIMTEIMYPEGGSIEQHLSPEVYARLEEYCDAYGVYLPRLKRFKPAIITTTIMTSRLSTLGVTGEGVDWFFTNQATVDEKPIRSLEPPEDQVDVISSMGEGMENQLISDALDEMETIEKVYAEVISAWRIGDTKKLDFLLNSQEREETPEMYEAVLVNRNQTWLPKIEACLTSPETEFILVGAAHLVGDDGIIEVLKTVGYVVEPLRAN